MYGNIGIRSTVLLKFLLILNLDDGTCVRHLSIGAPVSFGLLVGDIYSGDIEVDVGVDHLIECFANPCCMRFNLL